VTKAEVVASVSRGTFPIESSHHNVAVTIAPFRKVHGFQIISELIPAQLWLYFDRCQVTNLLLPPEIAAVAEKFTLANGY
jgi:hypothetical protein